MIEKLENLTALVDLVDPIRPFDQGNQSNKALSRLLHKLDDFKLFLLIRFRIQHLGHDCQVVVRFVDYRGESQISS